MADKLYTKSSFKDLKAAVNTTLTDWDLKNATGNTLAEHLKALYATGRASLRTLAEGLQNGFEKSFRQHAENVIIEHHSRHERDDLFLTNFTNILKVWPAARPLLIEQQEIVTALDGLFKDLYEFLNSQKIKAISLPEPTPAIKTAITTVNSTVAGWLATEKFAEVLKILNEQERLSSITKLLASINREHMDLVTTHFVALLDAEQKRLEAAIESAKEQFERIKIGEGSSVAARLRKVNAEQARMVAHKSLGQDPSSGDSAPSSPMVGKGVSLGDLPPQTTLSHCSLPPPAVSPLIAASSAQAPSPSPRRLSKSTSRAQLNAGLASEYVAVFTTEVSSKRLQERADMIEAKLKSFAEGNTDQLMPDVVKLVKPQLEQLLEEVKENLQKYIATIGELHLDPADPDACLRIIEGTMQVLDRKDALDDVDAEVQQELEERQAHITATKEQANKRFTEFQAASITDKELSLIAILDIFRDALAGLGSIDDVSERAYYKALLDTENNRFTELKAQADRLHDMFNASIAALTPQQAIDSYIKAIADIQGLDPLVAGHYKSLLEHGLHDMQGHVTGAEESHRTYLASIQEQVPTVRLNAVVDEIKRLASDDSVAPHAQVHQLILLQEEQSTLQASIAAAERLFDGNKFIFSAYQLDSLGCVWQVNQAMITAGIQEALASVDGLAISELTTKDHYVGLLQQADKTLPALMAAAIQQFDSYRCADIESYSKKLEALAKAKTELVVQNRQDYHVSFLLEKIHDELAVSMKEAEKFVAALCPPKLMFNPEQQLARVQAELKVVESPLKLVLRRLNLLKTEGELQNTIRKAAADRVASARQEGSIAVLPITALPSSPRGEVVALGDLPPPVVGAASRERHVARERKVKKQK